MRNAIDLLELRCRVIPDLLWDDRAVRQIAPDLCPRHDAMHPHAVLEIDAVEIRAFGDDVGGVAECCNRGSNVVCVPPVTTEMFRRIALAEEHERTPRAFGHQPGEGQQATRATTTKVLGRTGAALARQSAG